MPATGVTTPKHDAQIAALTFAGVYPHYVEKVKKKGRTVAELDQVISWLTGYSPAELERLKTERVTFAEFFAGANLPETAKQIKGVICGYRVEEIQTPLTQQVRYLDKLVDELAKGKAMEKVLRQ